MRAQKAHGQGRQTILSDANIFRRHPSPHDVTELQALIATNESSVASLNEEIEACSRQLSALHAKSCAHTLTIRRCQAAMTLARLIPPELLARIFEHASKMGWTRAPIVVSRVCSTWRAAAHSHPGVWSRLTVNLDMRNPVGWTDHWLSMARQVPLHVKIMHTAPDAPLEKVLALLLEHSERWVSLTLDLHFSSTRQVLAACTAYFAKLRSVDVSLYVADGNLGAAEGTIEFPSAFQDAPSLISVSTTGNVLPRGLPPRLTSLHIEYTDPIGFGVGTPRSVAETLRNLSELETLTLRLGVLVPTPLTPPDNPGIELPKLKTLVYEDLWNGDFQILNYLSAPSLTHLHARAQPNPEVDGSPARLVSLLEGSPNVESLELYGVDTWPVQLSSTLSLLPRLRKLYLHDSDIDDEAIERMYGRDGLCPDLQRIDLRWCQHVRGTTLVRLVESRVEEGGWGIEEVAAIGCSLVRKQDVMQLASLTTFRVVIGERDEHCREFDLFSRHSAYSSPDLVFAQARGNVAITSSIANGSSSIC